MLWAFYWNLKAAKTTEFCAKSLEFLFQHQLFEFHLDNQKRPEKTRKKKKQKKAVFHLALCSKKISLNIL